MKTQRPIYLDYMATTPIDPKVIDEMLSCMGYQGAFGNAHSKTHVYGQMAADLVEKARFQVAESIGAVAEDIIFTSGATEANNLAILGASRFYQRKGRHVVTMVTEHKSVLDGFKQLEREGFEVTYLKPNEDGLLSLTVLENALREDTILVSIMQVNNEIGVVQDIESIGRLLQDKGIVFHVDAAQSAGKLPIDLSTLSVSLMSISAHKNYGPKGVGALYIRHKPRIRLQAQNFGGGQERGLRAGTLATHQIVGMGAAFALSQVCQIDEQQRILSLRQQLWTGIKDIPGIRLNGHEHARIAGNLNFSVAGIDGALLVPALSELAVSTTSACMSAQSQPSYVLEALGVSRALALSTIRLSLGRYTTQSDVDKAKEVIVTQLQKLLS